MTSKIKDSTHYRFDVAVEMTTSKHPYEVLIIDKVTGIGRATIVNVNLHYAKTVKRNWNVRIYYPSGKFSHQANYSSLDTAIGMAMTQIIRTTNWNDFKSDLIPE